MVEAFAMNCCLYSVLDKSFEFRDANTVSSLLANLNQYMEEHVMSIS